MGRAGALNRGFSILVLVLGLLACAGSDAGAGFTLVSGRSPEAAFLITPGQAEKMGACGIASGMIEDFNLDLYECAGCVLPVVESDDGASPVISFKIEDRPVSDLDRFGITFPDERTMLITGSTHSLRWALNHVLEEYAGVRWLLPSKYGAHFPRIDDLTVLRREVSVSPSFYLSRRPTSPHEWRVRMGSHFVGRGGAYRVPCGHDLWLQAFPVRRYIREGEFPEYIFPVIGGERYLPYEDPARKSAWREYTGRWSDYAAGWHQCMTDERVVDEAVRNISAYFDSSPEVYGVSIALNDMGAGYCECEGCEKLKGEGRVMTGHRDYSDLYFQWANRVAERVAEKHPDKFFGTLAYRETLEPPGFKLHDNIVPYITYDIQSCEDPEVRANWTDLLERWSEKAGYLGRYEYGWGEGVYVMPRVYFNLQQEMMRADYENGVRACWGHASSGAIGDGPKKYLYHKLMWDVDLDLEETLREWYESAFGAEAAPYAAEYFRIWEEIWREEAVKTSWFLNSKNSIYLSRSNQGYLYAVRPGDLERLRGLMESVAELAGRHGDERQAKRAEWMMADFEYTEAVVYASGGDIFPPSGMAETKEQALEYIARLAEAVMYDELRPELHRRRMAVHLDPNFRDPGRPGVYEALAKVAGTASEPEVMKALIAASGDERLPSDVRALIGVLVRMERGEPVANLMLDGSFEEGNKDFTHHPLCPYAEPVVFTGERSYRGENSIKLELGPPYRYITSTHGRDFPHITSTHGRNFPHKRVEPGRYYASMMVYIASEHPDVESNVGFRVTARCIDGKTGGAHFDSPNVNVPPGEWTRISVTAEVGGGRNSLNLSGITLSNYSEEDTAYIDDVVLVALEK